MDSDYYSQSQSQRGGSHTSKTAGTIQKIHMKNFMCHDNLEIELNPRINFIIGKNGSGKSAIQTAVAVGLGGKALATNRGSSLKALIKNDKSSCTISIVINNEGELAYMPGTYGTKIKVERTFSHSSGGYKIKNSNDKLVSTERKEVDKIVNYFNIQPENPLCILQQDMARNFLNSSDPKKKFTFYMKASRLGEISRLYNECRCRGNTIKEILDGKFQGAKEAFMDVLEMKQKLKIMEEAKEKREKCAQLEKELLWAGVNEHKLELKRLQKKLETENQGLMKLQQQLRDIQDNRMEEKLRELESIIKEINDKVEGARQNLEQSKKDYADKNKLFTESVGRFNSAKEMLKSRKVKYDSCIAEIEKLSMNSPEIQQKQENLKAELERTKEELNALKAAESTQEHDRQQLIKTVDVTREKLQSLTHKLAMHTDRSGKLMNQITHLSKSKSNLSIYGEGIVAIVEEVEKAARQRKFIKKPIGPIGRHISVRDPKWTAAIENFIGKGFLSSFCVDNAKDSKVLSDIIHSVCSRIRNFSAPPIFCSKFLPHVHDFSRNETQYQQYTNLARALDIDNPVVANCLIDQMEPEAVLLIPSNREAYPLMDKEDKVPRNCKKVFTLSGDQFVPAPNYKSYSAMRPVTRANLLHANQEDLLRELKHEKDRLVQEKDLVGKEKNAVTHQLGELSTTLRKTELELKKLKAKSFDTEQKIRQLTLELQDSENQTNCKFLEEEAQDLKNQLEEQTRTYEELKSECEKFKCDLEEARLVYEKNKSTIDESNRQKAPIQGEIQRLRSKMQEDSSKADLIKHQEKAQMKIVSKTESRIEEIKKEVATTQENASQSCEEEVETDRPKEDIEKELNAVKVYLRSLEEKLGGTVDVLQDNLRRRQAIFDAVTNDLNELRIMLRKLKEALRTRRNKHESIQTVLMTSAKLNFQLAIKERGFEGKLDFDIPFETLEIKVSRPQQSGEAGNRLDTSSLSGGEKSYSTVCFMMALWNEIALPFHFMDEFDVFMDGINRKTVINMLLGHAKSVNQQFVFLTPLDASSIPEDDDITIHRLAAPRQ